MRTIRLMFMTFRIKRTLALVGLISIFISPMLACNARRGGNFDPGVADPDSVGGKPNEEAGGGGIRGNIGDEGHPLGGVAEDLLSGGIEKPVGFVNHGTINATVRAFTWVPLGEEDPQTPSGASTVSTAATSPGLWPNPSRFLTLPLGTYTWCIDWEEGDLDDDGKVDYFHYIEENITILDESDSDELDLAEQVDIVAPPIAEEIRTGPCGTAGFQGLQVFSGDARNFANPPDGIAIANRQHRPTPAEFTLATSCVDTCWLYQDVVGIHAGHYIEATSNVPTTTMGVQLWGDENDGWAQLLLDGQEIWSGDTMGEPPDYFIKYFSVSGLPLATHTLRVVHTSGGTVTVAFFGIGETSP